MANRKRAKKPARKSAVSAPKLREPLRRQRKTRVPTLSQSPARARKRSARRLPEGAVAEPLRPGVGRALGRGSMPAESVPSARGSSPVSDEVLRTGHGSAKIRGTKSRAERVSRTGRAMRHATRGRA